MYFRISELDFFKEAKLILPQFKIRAAYGEAGVQPGVYDRQITLSANQIDDKSYLSNRSEQKNQNLSVQISKEFEVGTDLVFSTASEEWFNAIGLSLTYWQRWNNNIIGSTNVSGQTFTVPVPPSTGSTSTKSNALDIAAHGIQFSLSPSIYSSKDFYWGMTFNFTRSVSTVTKIAGGSELAIGNNFVIREGQNIGAFLGYKPLTSIDERRSDGTYYIDRENVGNYSIASTGYVVNNTSKQVQFTDQKTIIGDATPDFILSIINDFSLFERSLTVSFQLDWKQGGNIYNQTRQWLYRDYAHKDFETPITVGNETKAWASYYNSLYKTNDPNGAFVEDGSFLRLRNYIMKGISFKRLILSLFLVFFASCEKELGVIDPNEPTTAALSSEIGIVSYSRGFYNVMLVGFNYGDFVWVTQVNHEIMGDNMYVPFGNMNWRWVNQPTSITLDDGTIVKPPEEGEQKVSLRNRNTIAFGFDNAFCHEWISMYKVINASNVMLEKYEGVSFTSDGDVKKQILKAWAEYWKGYAYSRIGLMYTAGIITDKAGELKNEYVSKEKILEESSKWLQKATATLDGIMNQDVLKSFVRDIIPTKYASPSTTSEWIQAIASLNARTLMASKKDKDKTTADWQSILDLTKGGIQKGGFEFHLVNDNNNFLTSTTIGERLTPKLGWHFVSPRLVQTIDTINDMRFRNHFIRKPTLIHNRFARGIQFATRWGIKDGGRYGATGKVGANKSYIGPTYEENELMKAEALLRLDQPVNDALTIVDGVRTYQEAGLTATSGTGKTKDQALEIIRKERRIALFTRGVAFYDARRYGVIDPVSEGGGLRGAWVFNSDEAFNTNATIDYNYMNYWDVPANEVDLNKPSSGSASVMSPK
ncbi:hypothetical protein CHS0354_024155 [Potamilus streckersoni]|uniref:RagB/SusD domain-containing protein n=1 Tax=Potamilus streckersoni TaxID=2493646 RepID=A0AAE0VM27_9BIVA|nr:hypothetical protein CHS0354_024155 [Potamilus streckersoni]